MLSSSNNSKPGDVTLLPFFSLVLFSLDPLLSHSPFLVGGPRGRGRGGGNLGRGRGVLNKNKKPKGKNWGRGRGRGGEPGESGGGMKGVRLSNDIG